MQWEITSDILLPTIIAILAVAVAVKLRDIILQKPAVREFVISDQIIIIVHQSKGMETYRQDPTPPMQPIAILTNQILQDPPILQFHKSHMCRTRDSLQRVDSFQISQSSLAFKCPDARGAAKIRDAYYEERSGACYPKKFTSLQRGRGVKLTRRCGDTGSGEGDEVLAFLYVVY